MIYDIEANEKIKWYELRKKLSNLFLKIAKKLYPENPAIKAFFLKQMTDIAIYGQSITHINHDEFYRKENKNG